MRGSLALVLALAVAVAALLLCSAPVPAFGADSVSVTFDIGPCLRVTSSGELWSNVSAFSFVEPDFLTYMAR